MSEKKLTKADYASDQEVRWCPGCGDYAILASVQKTFAHLNVPTEKTVFISGIGCAGRFPYYMNTYGFHTIHGRAPAIATGLKLSRPDLSVWIITGDGDALSIGGNHLLHILRRNIDVKILLFNNQIYGLTKGQYSPTSELGKVTKTSPRGNIDRPLDPITIALAAGATFVARCLDVDAKGLQSILKAAESHKGSVFIEIYQNCNIFNDGAFASFADKSVRREKTLWLEEGKLLVFGTEDENCIVLNGLEPKVMKRDEVSDADILHHNLDTDSVYPNILAQLKHPEFPVPLGIFRATQETSYEEKILSVDTKDLKTKQKECQELFHGGDTWKVK